MRWYFQRHPDFSDGKIDLYPLRDPGNDPALGFRRVLEWKICVSGSRQESYIIYLMFALFMIISGGYLFPSEFLPEAARRIARLLPLYHIRVMAECAVNGGRGMGDEYWQSLSYCIIFSAAAGILSYVISRFAIYRDSGVRLSQTKEGRGQG